MLCFSLLSCFFLNDPATTEIYTLSLHDALPIWGKFCSIFASGGLAAKAPIGPWTRCGVVAIRSIMSGDRKSTRLNSSHANISYAVFCLKKKKKQKKFLEDIAHAEDDDAGGNQTQ